MSRRLQTTPSAECASDINGSGQVGVYGSSCMEDSCTEECAAPINLDQIAGVAATASANMDDRGNPASVIDMDHTPGN